LEQIGVPNGFSLCKGSFIGKILAMMARFIALKKTIPSWEEFWKG